MPAVLSTLLANARSMLDEVATPRFWSDAELTVWLNEGVRDIARRSETLQSFHSTIPVVAGTPKYALPASVIRISRVEFKPTGQTQLYPLHGRTYQEMDQIWGTQQLSQSSYPMFFVIWGTPGVAEATSILNIQLFPVPSQAGTLNVFFYRLPTPMAAAGDPAEIPEGWEDLLVDYCEYRAKRKDKDPQWKEAKDEYEEKVFMLIDQTRQWHESARTFMTASGPQPGWLYEMSD